MSEDQNTMSVKAYLVKPDGSEEVRRFGIPEGASTNFSYLEERIRIIFNLGTRVFKLTWQDSDGDNVVISSDEELMEAITECLTRQGQQLLRVFIVICGGDTLKKVHTGVACDGCGDEPLVGTRYKCKTCSDYDLCSGCEGKGIHNHHQFIKNPTPQGKESDNTAFEFMSGMPDFGDDLGGGGWCSWRGRKGGRGRGGGCRGWKRWAGMGHIPEEGPSGHHHYFRQHHFHSSSGNGRAGDSSKPVHWSFSGICPPYMGFGAGVGVHDPQRVAEEACKVAEEASKAASQLASKHVADIMKGMWSAWSGQSQDRPQAEEGPRSPTGSKEHSASASASASTSTSASASSASSASASALNTASASASFSKTSDPVETEMEDKEDAAAEKSPRQEDEAQPPSADIPVVDLAMDVDDELPNKEQRESPRKESTSPVEDWTLVNKDCNSKEGELVDSHSPPEEAPSKETTSDSSERTPQHPDERVRNALVQMRDMGYSDEGGWLTRLLEMKKGDINQVLDLLLVHRK